MIIGRQWVLGRWLLGDWLRLDGVGFFYEVEDS